MELEAFNLHLAFNFAFVGGSLCSRVLFAALNTNFQLTPAPFPARGAGSISFELDPRFILIFIFISILIFMAAQMSPSALACSWARGARAGRQAARCARASAAAGRGRASAAADGIDNP